jgi:oligoribonuclease
MNIDVKRLPLVWMDLEMTGLVPERDRIIEMAVIITDSELNIVSEGPVLVVHQSEELLSGMDAWNTEHHGASGLITRVRESEITESEAEKIILSFIEEHVAPQQSPLCGNSIYQDRRFLYRYMPKLEAYFHYRNLDVSTVKELARRWSPEMYDQFKKTGKHLALDDIKESIDELKHYRRHFFKI